MFLIELINIVANIVIWIIILDIALFWLAAFNIVNMNNPNARNLVALIKRVTDPIFKPLRKYIPPLGGIDLTPIIAIIGISIIEQILIRIVIAI